VSGVACVGGLIGDTLSASNYSSQVLNCSYTGGNVIGTGNGVGGLVGRNEGVIQNCSVVATLVSGVEEIGGVTGRVGNLSRVEKCSVVVGNVQGTKYTGGIIGYSFPGAQLLNSYFNGNVTGIGDYVAGVVGFIDVGAQTTAKLENCYATGSVSGASYVAGIVGSPRASQLVVKNCYSASSISGSGDYIGGVSGYITNNSQVQNCVALNPSVVTSLPSAANVGRITGYTYSTTLISGNYARDNMTVTIGGATYTPNPGAALKDGADAPMGITLNSLFNPGNGWDDTAIWIIPGSTLAVNGPLPILRNMPGPAQTPTLPTP
jgi:hypothetical protein